MQTWQSVPVKMLCVFVAIMIAGSLSAQPARNCGTSRFEIQDVPAAGARIFADEILYIPVVFHVVYALEAQNISDEQIFSQLQVINEDFNRKNADTMNTLAVFKDRAASARIQFYLASGGTEHGITRTPTTHGVFHNDDLHLTAKGGHDAWDTDHYLNVWVADLAPGIFGYGSEPGGPAFRDGVAIHYAYFGRHENAVEPYHLGRTLTHEIGHWLGLPHPWGTGGCSSDDGLADTPAQEGPASGCTLDMMSCGTLNMVQNFMNTSVDVCMNLFTKDQAELMRNTLIVHRPNVYSDERNVTATGPQLEPAPIFLYPNPVLKQPVAFVTIRPGSFKPCSLAVMDLQGRCIRQYEIGRLQENLTIDLEGLKNGIYIARIRNNSTVFTTKIYLNLN